MKYSGSLLVSFFFTVISFGQQKSLDYFFEQAKTNSPLIKEYQQQILINRLDSQLLRASLKTQVNFLSTNSYAPIIKGYGYDEAITNGANVSAIVQASRNFVNRKNLVAQFSAIALQNLTALDSMHLTERNLALSIADQYITAYGNQLAMEYNRDVYDLLKSEEIILKKLTQGNVYRQTDYLTFFITLQQQELTWLQSKNQYQSDLLSLYYLAGMRDTTMINLQAPAFNDSLKADFSKSVFYRQFFNDSLRLQNQKALINNEYRPKIGAYADGGYNSSLAYLPYKNFGVSAGISLTIPIYDARQKQMKMAKVDIAERTRQDKRDYFINQYRQQLDQLNLQLGSFAGITEKIDQQIKYSRTLIAANNRLLETGDIKVADFILVINNYLAAKNLFNQNYISRLHIINQISYWNR